MNYVGEPPPPRKRNPPGRPKHISAEQEEKFFLLANMMWGEPNVGKHPEAIRANFIANPDHVLKLRQVKPYLDRDSRGIEFASLAVRFGYNTANAYQLYRRYANWYFRQGAIDASKEALRDSGQCTGKGETTR